MTLTTQQHEQVEKLAEGIAASASLPGFVNEVLEAGLEATRPDLGVYEEMLHEEAINVGTPAGWQEAVGVAGVEDLDVDVWR